MRESGVLLAISSLPSKYGIGCFSKEAYQFIDFLKAAGQTYWQILPLGQTGYGDSPYQSFSTFAGNPYYIDLESLIEEQLLTRNECNACDFGIDETKVDYGKLFEYRNALLHKAFERKNLQEDEGFEAFRQENSYWIEDYALYMAVKKHFGDGSWESWEDGIRLRTEEAIAHYTQELSEEISFYIFLQYLFSRQWKKLKDYANENGIQIIGDIPIYVAFDSADAWAHPELFQFDENRMPISVAGCPPDGFSEDGQLWGNPLYKWDYHKQTDYSWWIKRVECCYRLYDVIRIDHFRGFDEYYSIPFGEPTARNGHWEKGPGMDLFKTIEKKLGHIRIIAEDLGFITDTVKRLVADSGYPNMKVLEFAFDSRESSNYLPHTYDKNCVVYTGTHDNDTITGWYKALNKPDKRMADEYLNLSYYSKEEKPWQFVRLAMLSCANTCIIPMQDFLGLDSSARMNIPATLGGNWQWRMEKKNINKKLAKKILKLTHISARLPKNWK